MTPWKWLLVLLMPFALMGCARNYKEIETGYKGQAQVDPWLAAERFLGGYGLSADLNGEHTGGWTPERHPRTP